MTDYNEPTTGGEVGEVNPGGDPPDDNRNEQVDDSPAPDPTTGDTNADDVPDAD